MGTIRFGLSALAAFSFVLGTEVRAADSAQSPAENSPSLAQQPAAEPFAFADFGWLNGNSRQTEFSLETKYFTGQFTFDANYVYDFAHPKDHTLIGSTNSGRTSELQVQQLGIGGDFHYQNIRGRLMTQFGMYSTMTPRNDASPSRGQWDLSDAYRYVSEAYGGYHWDTWNGINLDAGIFMSYIGLFSYYNNENWAYQASYTSANTPWFFNGLRLQMFPSERLKAEFWVINGWQSYGMFNESPGLGFQLLWRPTGDLSFVTNEYYGYDTLGQPGRMRVHSDNSVQYKYFDQPAHFMGKAAFSLTIDLGCENGGGVKCTGGDSIQRSQNFAGFMAYNRFWFDKDRYGLTFGGGYITNPGRYLVLTPPINGATAANESSSFSQMPGDEFKAWDASINFDYMPSKAMTFRIEFDHRESNVPYFAGSGGITPPGGNQGSPGSDFGGFQPDLAKRENRINTAMMIRL